MDEQKIREWRPDECNTRIGDEVVVNGVRFLKIKCRRCSKRDGVDSFHYIKISV